MDPTTKKDREFINEVWKKARYIEYMRNEQEEKVKENARLIKKKQLKFISIFAIGILMILIPIIVSQSIDEGLAIILGVYLLAFSCYYENFIKV